MTHDARCERDGKPYRRFLVSFEPEPTSGCWLWTGVIRAGGYGQFYSLEWGRVAAHRAAWSFYFGPIPEGLFVCHQCDVRSCVNPAHLFLGTARDNNLDTQRKGKLVAPCGERNGRAKLTPDAVRLIRTLDGVWSRRRIAREFHLAQSTVLSIHQGEKWKHLL